MKIKRVKLCECGCGEIVNPGRRFILGHARKNKPMSEDHKRKIGDANKISLLGNTPWNKEKSGIYSEEHLAKLRNSHIGNEGFWTGKVRSEETNEKIRNTVLKLWENPDYIEKHKGQNHPAWREDSHLPYSNDWTEDLKDAIRKRDNFACQLCSSTENNSERKHPVHHIDYNKLNCDPNNLITLCISCHAKTNFKKRDWELFFKNKIGLLKVENE